MSEAKETARLLEARRQADRAAKTASIAAGAAAAAAEAAAKAAEEAAHAARSARIASEAAKLVLEETTFTADGARDAFHDREEQVLRGKGDKKGVG